MNLPNRLTISRLVLCVVLIVCLEWKGRYGGMVGFGVFVVASLTDWLDGWLARRWKLVTDLGKLLDPLADKILISIAYVGLVVDHMAPFWLVVCIISREFLITGLRSLAAAKGVILSAEKAGKHKTISQSVTAALGLLLLALQNMQGDSATLASFRHWVFEPLLWITLVVTLYSGAIYCVKNWKLLFSEEA